MMAIDSAPNSLRRWLARSAVLAVSAQALLFIALWTPLVLYQILLRQSFHVEVLLFFVAVPCVVGGRIKLPVVAGSGCDTSTNCEFVHSSRRSGVLISKNRNLIRRPSRGIELVTNRRKARRLGVLNFFAYADRNYWTTTGWEDDAVQDFDEGACRSGEGRSGDAGGRGQGARTAAGGVS